MGAICTDKPVSVLLLPCYQDIVLGEPVWEGRVKDPDGAWTIWVALWEIDGHWILAEQPLDEKADPDYAEMGKWEARGVMEYLGQYWGDDTDLYEELLGTLQEFPSWYNKARRSRGR